MRFLVCLLLLIPQVALAQSPLIIGIKPSQAQIEEAKKKAAEGKKAEDFLTTATAPIVKQINVGEWFQFTIGSSGQLWLWNGSIYDSKSAYPVLRIDQLKGVAVPLVKQKVDGSASVETIPALDADGGSLLGVKAGHLTIAVIVNGEASGAPIITQIIDLTVGTPGPPPPPPVDPTDPIIIAANADFNAGKGNKADVGLYREYLKHVASDLPQLGPGTFKTLGEFFNSLKTGTANLLGDPNTGKLSGLRHAVGNYLSTTLPTNAGDPWTADLAKKIADQLNAVATKLEGVK